LLQKEADVSSEERGATDTAGVSKGKKGSLDRRDRKDMFEDQGRDVRSSLERDRKTY